MLVLYLFKLQCPTYIFTCHIFFSVVSAGNDEIIKNPFKPWNNTIVNRIKVNSGIHCGKSLVPEGKIKKLNTGAWGVHNVPSNHDS